jgi:hypothetical protein
MMSVVTKDFLDPGSAQFRDLQHPSKQSSRSGTNHLRLCKWKECIRLICRVPAVLLRQGDRESRGLRKDKSPSQGAKGVAIVMIIVIITLTAATGLFVTLATGHFGQLFRLRRPRVSLAIPTGL